MINRFFFRVKCFCRNPIYYFYLIGNRVKFSFLGIKYGKNLKVFNSLYIRKHKQSQIIIGDSLTFSSGGCYNPLSRNLKGCIHTSAHGKIIIGNNVGLSSTIIWCADEIKIGDNTLIGADCILLDTDAHSLDYMVRKSKKRLEDGCSMDSFYARKAPINIGSDVLIGTRCIVLKGVTIGNRSIIAAGSVVTSSIPSDCIAGGNPCRVIRVKN